ncbi:hypothetical protein K2224_07535 [Streptomyces sp. BHT-5-2]|uniref:hypothetical protein n=1 Tax=unclassified Streptomyces TaxID=2593676 RepID=UPI001C8D3B9B|nr:hypothetical protein [Streptomyces sp. BHT-5-2]QZL03090.1 hypothetical protein K2224_07535 [Streptomyces sp. BHT-5-2]
MRRINVVQFTGKPQAFVAHLEIEEEEAERRWGPCDITSDDFASWITFAFELADGTPVALFRERDFPPAPGFIMSAIGNRDLRDVLNVFLGEADLPSDCVTGYKGFD